MSESWQRARIIPISGIRGDREAEQRATSAVLAVLTIVRPFSKALLTPLGASKADRALVEAFVEPQIKAESGTRIRPDGLIRVTHGSRDPWVALVEVKTGASRLEAEQVNAYWDVARSEGFDCVLTISNEIAPSPGVHPTEGLRVRSNSRVQVHHSSWTRLLTEAVKEKTHRGIDDPEQEWILGELIRYLRHPASGVVDFDDMGTNWTTVRDGARDGTLNSRDDAVVDIAQRWDQLLGYISLRLGADIGADVTEVIPRSERNDPKLRTKHIVDTLCANGQLEGTLRIPNTAGDLEIAVNLKARQCVTTVQLDAPSDKGARGRVSWLTRQLRDCPPNLVIEAYPKNASSGIAGTLSAVAEDSSLLVGADGKPPHRFRLIARTELGPNRHSGKGRGFVESVTAAIESFYGDVLQDLTSYQPKAPKLRPQPEPDEAEQLPSVPLVNPTPQNPPITNEGDDPMAATEPNTWSTGT
ncbi:hypothetical protein [Candidatus Poriferisocius sp.]|uniref:hypothetical protein n=1 Tax=Candidatus Poriferisocius sp. TaxID=3101276 RepID=UPI003B5A339D